MDQQKSCLLKLASKKRRGKDAHMFFSLIYFFASFSIFYIPHNYVILQAVPHAIPQTQSAFYPHRLFLTTSRHFLQTNLLVTKLRLLRRFNFGSHLLTSMFDGLFRNRLIVFAFRDHYLQTNFWQRIQSTTDMPLCSCDRTFSSPEPVVSWPNQADWLWGRECCSYKTAVTAIHSSASFPRSYLFLPQKTLGCRAKVNFLRSFSLAALLTALKLR